MTESHFLPSGENPSMTDLALCVARDSKSESHFLAATTTEHYARAASEALRENRDLLGFNIEHIIFTTDERDPEWRCADATSSPIPISHTLT